MVAISIKCPSCNREFQIDLPSNLISVSRGNMLGITVSKDRCCSDKSFMAFFDTNFKVLGYEVADVEITFRTRDKKNIITNSTSAIDINSIIDVVGANIVSILMRAILVQKPIFFLDSFDKDDYARKLIQYIQEIKPENLKISTRLIKVIDLNAEMFGSLNPFVCAINFKAILHTPFNAHIRNSLENILLKDASNIPDRQGQMAFLKLELTKIYNIINDLASMIISSDFYYEEDIPAYLKKKFNYKVKSGIIDSFKEILGCRFGLMITSRLRNKLAESLGFFANS